MIRGGGFVASVEPPRWRFWRAASSAFHRRAEGRVYCFTSIFLPDGIRTTIRHRWQDLDRERDAWVTAGVVPIRIEGGREGGYRGFSLGSNVARGRRRGWQRRRAARRSAIVDLRALAGEAVETRRVRL